MASRQPLPPPPRWVMLDRVALVCQDVDGAEGPRCVTASLPAPPLVSSLTVPARFHPDPDEHDRHPYVVAADHGAGLLIHLARWPFVGFDLALSQQPTSSLVLVRDFLPVVAGHRSAPTGSSVVRIPDRVPAMPRISNIKNLGLVALLGSGGADYIVAELRVDPGVNHAKMICFRSGAAAWAEKDLPRPDMPGRTTLYWGWTTDDVVAHDGKLWWVNLRRGLLSCNPFDDQPVLRLDDLPETVADEDQHRSLRDIEADRCVRVSRGRLRYVEITRASVDPVGATMVVMWTLAVDPADCFTWWKSRYGTMLGQIWASDSYKATEMPEEVPMLAVVNPCNPDIIYFFLGQYLFGVDVPESRVVEFVSDCNLVKVVDSLLPPPPISWRYVVAWELPPALCGGQHRQEPLMVRNEAAYLRRSEYALRMREDRLKKLEEGLLLRDAKKETQDDSSWNKIQIVLFGVLVTGLSVLFSFWPWLPPEFLRAILVAFGTVWVLGCVALPFALFGAGRWEIGFGHHAARAALMCFSVFVLYGLYCMSVEPAPGSDHSAAPAPIDPAGKRWGWIEYVFMFLGIASLGGQTTSWIKGCYRGYSDQ